MATLIFLIVWLLLLIAVEGPAYLNALRLWWLNRRR